MSAEMNLLGDFDFAAYEQTLDALSPEAQAQAALADILTVQTAEGATRSFQQIKEESELFFSNPLIGQIDHLMNTLATQYAAFCMQHGEGADIMNQGLLGEVFVQGVRGMPDLHDHRTHSHSHIKNTVDTRPSRSSSKKKEKKTKRTRLEMTKTLGMLITEATTQRLFEKLLPSS